MDGHPPVVAQREIEQMLQLSKRRVAMLIGADGFPAPIAHLSVSRIWSYDEVSRWADATGRSIHPIPARDQPR